MRSGASPEDAELAGGIVFLFQPEERADLASSIRGILSLPVSRHEDQRYYPEYLKRRTLRTLWHSAGLDDKCPDS